MMSMNKVSGGVLKNITSVDHMYDTYWDNINVLK